MQLQMNFLITPPPAPGVAPVWSVLDAQQRAEIVAALGSLIAKVVVAQDKKPVGGTEEKSDE